MPATPVTIPSIRPGKTMLTSLSFVGLSLLFALQSPAAEDLDLFYGKLGCLVVSERQSLTAQERLLILAPGIPPFDSEIRTVAAPANSTDCGKEFTELQDRDHSVVPFMVASVAVPQELRSEAVFAIRRHPGLLIHGGPKIRFSAEASARWASQVSSLLDEGWRAPDVLVQAYGYGASDASVELYLGRTTGPVSPSGAIQAITIERLFIVDGQVLASEQFDRASGREERVDTAAPILTRNDWADSDTEKTIAFLSDDGGRSWKRLSTNSGFEGVWWIVQEVRPGLPRTLERYLYTPPN